MCAMTHSYVWHDSLICVPWLIHMCDMTLAYVRHNSFTRGKTLAYGWHYSLALCRCSAWLGKDLCSCLHRRASMGWLWLVGSFKLQGSFAEYRLVYIALLQKRPMILRSLLIVATPYGRLYTGRDSGILVTWLIRTRHDSSICETWLTVRDMSHAYV